MDLLETEYRRFLYFGDNAKQQAEISYEKDDLESAARHYYHASLAYEQAKEIANTSLDVTKRIFAQEKEYYALEKLDELKRFKGVSTDELIR